MKLHSAVGRARVGPPRTVHVDDQGRCRRYGRRRRSAVIGGAPPAGDDDDGARRHAAAAAAVVLFRKTPAVETGSPPPPQRIRYTRACACVPFSCAVTPVTRASRAFFSSIVSRASVPSNSCKKKSERFSESFRSACVFSSVRARREKIIKKIGPIVIIIIYAGGTRAIVTRAEDYYGAAAVKREKVFRIVTRTCAPAGGGGRTDVPPTLSLAT